MPVPASIFAMEIQVLTERLSTRKNVLVDKRLSKTCKTTHDKPWRSHDVPTVHICSPFVSSQNYDSKSAVFNLFDYILQRYNCPMFSLQIYQETIRKLPSFSISQGFVRFRSIAQSKSRCDSRAHDAPSPWCGSSWCHRPALSKSSGLSWLSQFKLIYWYYEFMLYISYYLYINNQ